MLLYTDTVGYRGKTIKNCVTVQICLDLTVLKIHKVKEANYHSTNTNTVPLNPLYLVVVITSCFAESQLMSEKYNTNHY